MLKITGKSFYHHISIDTVATIVNDLVTTGALPVSVAMHAAVGDAEWFADARRSEDLASGFAQGCHEAGAVWGGGETPALQACPQLSAELVPITLAEGTRRAYPKCTKPR